ncbi:MAG: MBL fold metallo-hydrolase [Lachnospiraceae bacterium]|nr:MBL fold metallo-hydrolase [Lachnospiraceae bacterium]
MGLAFGRGINPTAPDTETVSAPEYMGAMTMASSVREIKKTPITVVPRKTDGNKDTKSRLEVHYIDVGQGDSSLIICDNEAMLVDAGDESKGTAIQLYLKKHNIERLKYVVATHPDADHIGGLDVIVYKFDCGQILIPNCSNDTPSFDRLIYSVKAKGYSPHIVDVGEKYSLGSAVIEILSPSSEFIFSDTNDSSIIFRLDHGSNSFLFTGDATIPPQQALIFDPDLDADTDVIKVPHHGAATAYIKGFYDEVSPEYAVISCGRKNPYGHPRQEVLDDLKNRGTKLYRTDEQGTVIATSDGKKITFNTSPSSTWKPGEEENSDKTVRKSDSAVTRVFQHNLSDPPEPSVTYVYNKNTGKFHYPGCSSVTDMSPKNRADMYCSREELIKTYPDAKPCKRCNP